MVQVARSSDAPWLTVDLKRERPGDLDVGVGVGQRESLRVFVELRGPCAERKNERRDDRLHM